MNGTTYRPRAGAIEELSRAQREAGARMARTVDQPRATLSILRFLAIDGPMQIGCVANRLRVDMSVASRQVSALVEAGLVERVLDDDDRRARAVRLTPDGASLAHDYFCVVDEAAAAVFASWSPAEIEAAAEQIRKVARAVASSVPHDAHPHHHDHHLGPVPAVDVAASTS